MTAKSILTIEQVDNIKRSQTSGHIPSKVQADTLFSFTDQLKWLIGWIKLGMLSPRYCEEDIRYLKIQNRKRMAYPMKCFCDINMHKLEEHLAWYGYYGIAFSKEWGMNHGIQPVQYINPGSLLCKDFSTAFSAALRDKNDQKSQTHLKLQNFILHEIMYYKPYSGKIKNRVTQKMSKKCFTDECEWRFVPDVDIEGYPQVIFDEEIFNAGTLTALSNAMEGISSISLTFEYSEIKYIIIKSMTDLVQLTGEIVSMGLNKETERGLISKIIVWDDARGDF